MVGVTGTSPGADHDYAIAIAQEEVNRADRNADAQTYPTVEQGYTLGRTAAHTSNQGTLDVGAAKAERDYELAIARADKQRLIDVFNEQGGASSSNLSTWDASQSQAEKDHRAKTADASLQQTTGVEDAKLQFQKNENAARKSYTLGLATGAQAQDTALAGIERSADRAEADDQFALDWAYAQAVQDQWSQEAFLNSPDNVAIAQANVAWWSAQESASVTAEQAIDAAYHLPWTAFLAAQAAAHQGWFNSSGKSAYLQWTGDRASDQHTWRLNVRQAQNQELATQRTAQRTETRAVADSTRDEKATIAAARYTYIAGSTGATGVSPVPGIATPAKDYLDNTAQADHDRAVALAKASHDLTINRDDDNFPGDPQAQYDQDVQDAEDNYNQAAASAESTYASVETSAVSTWISGEGNVKYSNAMAVAGYVKADHQSLASAAYAFGGVDEREYAALIAALAGHDKTHKLNLSSSIANAAASLAASSPSPWSAYFTSSQNAANTWEIAAAGAEESLNVSLAQAESGLNPDGSESGGGRLALEASLRDMDLARFDTDYAQAGTDAANDLSLSAAEASAAASNPVYPHIETAAAASTSPVGDSLVFTTAFAGWDVGASYFSCSFCAFGVGQRGGAALSAISRAQSILRANDANVDESKYLVIDHDGLGLDEPEAPPPDEAPPSSDDGATVIETAANHGPIDQLASTDPIPALVKLGDLADPSNPSAEAIYVAAAAASVRLPSGVKELPLSSTPLDPRVEEGQRRFREMLGIKEPPKSPAKVPNDPRIALDTVFGTILSDLPAPEPRAPTPAELRAARAADDRLLAKVAARDVQRDVEHGYNVPMTERHLLVIDGRGQVVKSETFTAKTDARALAQKLFGYNRDGFATKLVGHDAFGPGFADLEPLTMEQFFRGSSSEFRLAVLKQFKKLKLDARDPLSEENVTEVLDTLQLGLDILGLIPVVGKPFDAASGIVSAARGDVLGASITFAALATTLGGAGIAGVIARRAADAVDTAADAAKAGKTAVKATGAAAELVEQVRAAGNIEQTVADTAKKAFRDIDTAIRSGKATKQQILESLKAANPKITQEQAEEIVTQAARQAGETGATSIGKDVHKAIAEARRASGEFDLVQSAIKTRDGKPILVSRRVDLKTGAPAPDSPLQEAIPDAVSFKRDLIVDDKPLGRPIAKDRQEIIRNISAYEKREGHLPRTIAVTRYDPKTGEQLLTELYSPLDFLP